MSTYSSYTIQSNSTNHGIVSVLLDKVVFSNVQQKIQLNWQLKSKIMHAFTYEFNIRFYSDEMRMSE